MKKKIISIIGLILLFASFIVILYDVLGHGILNAAIGVVLASGGTILTMEAGRMDAEEYLNKEKLNDEK